jgi:hypothetical protein
MRYQTSLALAAGSAYKNKLDIYMYSNKNISHDPFDEVG